MVSPAPVERSVTRTATPAASWRNESSAVWVRTVTLGNVLALPIGGDLDPHELAPAQIVEIDEVARIALRPHRVADRRRHAPAAAEFHVAGADHALLGHRDGTVTFFHQHATHPAQPELAGEPQADRAGAGDNDRSLGICAHRSLY